MRSLITLECLIPQSLFNLPSLQKLMVSHIKFRDQLTKFPF
ncbi:hypothetical protein ACJIZ3_000998 [Penstemon smallii]|uniref:Uncharacterized protein n=1 Tax=Penstemon smallii TaxID=265156 RepID=A0ABD3U573_9LAMI